MKLIVKSNWWNVGGRKLDESSVFQGTRDFHPGQMKIRNEVFSSIAEIFKKHGANEIETPVFELNVGHWSWKISIRKSDFCF